VAAEERVVLRGAECAGRRSRELDPLIGAIRVAPATARKTREEGAVRSLVHRGGYGRGDLPPAGSGVVRPGPVIVEGAERNREHCPAFEVLEVGASGSPRRPPVVRPGPGRQRLHEGPHDGTPLDLSSGSGSRCTASIRREGPNLALDPQRAVG